MTSPNAGDVPTWTGTGSAKYEWAPPGATTSDHNSLVNLATGDVHTQYSLISSQSGAPSGTPSRVGLINVDTSSGDIYISNGTSSSGDWERVDGTGGGGSALEVQSDGTTVDDAVEVLDFSSQFTLTESPAHDIDIALATSITDSLALADSATQPGDNVSDLTNDAEYVTADGTRTFTGNVTIDLGGLVNTNLNINGSTDYTIRSSATDSFIIRDATAGVNRITLDSTGDVTFSGDVSASNLSGTNTGDQTITLTGDVTGSGTGSFATTVTEGAVTQHEAALSLTASQVSDFDEAAQDAVGNIFAASENIEFSYVDGTPAISALVINGSISKTKLTTAAQTSLNKADTAVQTVNGKSGTAITLVATDITSGTFADALISESSVTQHEAALDITESQITDLTPFAPGLRSGTSYSNWLHAGVPGTQSYPFSNFMFFGMMHSAQDTTMVNARIEVTTAATGSTNLARLGVYNDANGFPTTLIADLGTVDISTTGFKIKSSLSVSIPKGNWHLGILPSDSFSYRSWGISAALGGAGESLKGIVTPNTVNGMDVDLTTTYAGGLPATATPTQLASSLQPQVHWQI